MQADGNFVLYTADRAVVWTAETTGPGAHLVLQDDRNVVIVAADGTTVLWTPNCCTSPRPSGPRRSRWSPRSRRSRPRLRPRPPP